MVEDHLMGAEWWWNLSWAWLEVFMELGRRTLLTSVLVSFRAQRDLTTFLQQFGHHRDQAGRWGARLTCGEQEGVGGCYPGGSSWVYGRREPVWDGFFGA